MLSEMLFYLSIVPINEGILSKSITMLSNPSKEANHILSSNLIGYILGITVWYQSVSRTPKNKEENDIPHKLFPLTEIRGKKSVV